MKQRKSTYNNNNRGNNKLSKKPKRLCKINKMISMKSKIKFKYLNKKIKNRKNNKPNLKNPSLAYKTYRSLLQKEIEAKTIIKNYTLISIVSTIGVSIRTIMMILLISIRDRYIMSKNHQTQKAKQKYRSI